MRELVPAASGSQEAEFTQPRVRLYDGGQNVQTNASLPDVGEEISVAGIIDGADDSVAAVVAAAAAVTAAAAGPGRVAVGRHRL